jgi:branched-chain amino acid aminotransferase
VTAPEASFPPGCAWIDGRFVPMAEARLPILDWGFLRSDATYDVVHVWRGRFFRLDAHLDRFHRSMAALRLDPGLSRDAMTAILAECVRRSGLADAYVEMVSTRGMSPTFSRDPRDAVHRFMAFAIPFSWILRPEDRARGLHVALSARERIRPESVDPEVKNYHWLDMVMALMEARDAGAESVLMSDGAGHVLEGPGFNIFVISGGRIATPGRGVLGGITRDTVVALLSELGHGVERRPVRAEELREAEEIFATSTAGGVMPVTRLDGRPVRDARPGPLTERLMDLYWEAHARPAWITPVDSIMPLA